MKSRECPLHENYECNCVIARTLAQMTPQELKEMDDRVTLEMKHCAERRILEMRAKRGMPKVR